MHGQTLGEAHIRANTGVNVLAIRTAEGGLSTNLRAEHLLHIGDALIGLGTKEQLASLCLLTNTTPKTLHVPGELSL